MSVLESRVNSFSLDYLAAEIAAFPMASVASLRLGIVELNPALKDYKTKSLWREAEAYIAANRPSVSLDEAVLIRDSTWFSHVPRGAHSGTVALTDVLGGIASDLLRVDGRAAIPQYSGKHKNPRSAARQRFMWHEFSIPRSLLLASLEHKAGRFLAIDDLDNPLRHLLLKHGFAETHVHLGAALSFEHVWLALLVLLYRDDINKAMFVSPGAEFNEGADLCIWLLRTAIYRWILARCLSANVIHEDDCEALLRTDRVLGRIEIAMLWDDLTAFQDGRLSANRSFAELHQLYRRIASSGGRWMPRDGVEKRPLNDPISWMRTPSGVALSERWLLRLGLPRARGNTLFAMLFWQVVRMKAIYYRHLTMRPSSRGLQQFVRYFKRISPVKKVISFKSLVASASTLAGAGQGLIALELRKTPEDSVNEIHEFLKALTDAAANISALDRVEVGVVFHFSRDRGGQWSEGACSAFEWNGLHPPSGYREPRFQRPYKGFWRIANALTGCLTRFPHSLELWRGIDCCTDEQGIPPWLLQPLFRWIRRVSKAVGTNPREKPLKATAHAGEDFIHLLSGIRLVDESIRAFELTSGDRIGHGLALGIDPDTWCKRAGHVSMAREQRLFDLIWLAGFLKGEENVSALQFEAVSLGREVFRCDLKWSDLKRFYDGLWTSTNESAVSTSDVHPLLQLSELPADELRWKWTTDYRTHIRARTPIWVSTWKQGRLVDLAQQKVLGIVRGKSLCIEANPTSNLLVADLGDIHSHPLWRLSSPTKVHKRSLPICLGADDPLLICSNLPTEYQRLFDAMAYLDVPYPLKVKWLVRALRLSKQVRFTGG